MDFDTVWVHALLTRKLWRLRYDAFLGRRKISVLPADPITPFGTNLYLMEYRKLIETRGLDTSRFIFNMGALLGRRKMWACDRIVKRREQ